MSQVIVQINGRNYTMQCDDGQEEHLRGLARMIDAEINAIRGSVGQLGDLRLLIMASLVIADRLSQAERKAAAIEEQLQGLRITRNQTASQLTAVEEAAAKTLDAAALRLETLAETAASYLSAAPEDGAAPPAGARPES